MTPWTVSCQSPLSMELSRQEYWSGLPFPSPGDLPNPGIEPKSPALQVDSLPAEPQGKPKNTGMGSLSLLQLIFPTQKSIQSLEFSRPEYWSGLPLPSPRDLPDLRIKSMSPALQADSLPTESLGKPLK